MGRQFALLFLIFFFSPLKANHERETHFLETNSLVSNTQLGVSILKVHFQLTMKKFFTTFLDNDLNEEKELYKLKKELMKRQQNGEIGGIARFFIDTFVLIIKTLPTLIILAFFYLFFVRKMGNKVVYWAVLGVVFFMLFNVSAYRYQQAKANRLVELLTRNFPTHPIVEKLKTESQRAEQVVESSMSGIQVIKVLGEELQKLPASQLSAIQTRAVLYGLFSAFSTLIFYVVLWGVLVVIEWGILV